VRFRPDELDEAGFGAHSLCAARDAARDSEA